MTLPAFSAAGTGSETAPAWPSHAAGDLGLLFVETASGVVATPTDWTFVAHSGDGVSVASALWVFRRVATSGAEGAPSITGGSNHLYGVILTFTGVNTSTPIHGIAKQLRGPASGQTLPGTQTFLDDCMIVQACARSADAAGALASGTTNASLVNFTERFDDGTITGNGGGVVVYTGELATKGVADPAVSLGFSVASGLGCMTLALQAADKQLAILANKSRAVNTGM